MPSCGCIYFSLSMKIPSSVVNSLVLLVGAAFGAAGALMFKDSLPGREGTPEARAAALEVELKKAETKIAALESGSSSRRERPGKTSTDKLREIVENMREGRPVTPDDLLRVSQPLMRDLSPLFERVRVKEEKAGIDQKVGEITRKYGLNDSQREMLKAWYERQAEESAREHTDLWANPNVTLEEMIRASKGGQSDKGLDAFMGGMLQGDALSRFQTDRMTEKSQRVQADADRRMERIDGIVKLDDVQRDQVFGIMAKESADYDPKMQFQWGAGGEPAADATLLSVLRPEQKQALEAEKERKRAEAEQQLGEVGLALPENWDFFDEL